ncbi:MAG: 1-acyl-sn-glycerol-3-phosphate acyltransferase [Thermomicrobiales bacterium]
MPWRFLNVASKAFVKQRLDLQVEGLEHVPKTGPVLIAARHFHHLYDGCAVIATVPRPCHVLVALDWVSNKPGRAAMEGVCRAARWPIVVRPGGPGAAGPAKAAAAFRAAARDCLDLWREQRILLVFPEGYPNVDPGYTPKLNEEEFLPFQIGYLRLVELAQRQGMQVPIVPAGLSYERGIRWQVKLRFGTPVFIDTYPRKVDAAREIEAQVGKLSSD